jgi:serine/threonine protein kinase
MQGLHNVKQPVIFRDLKPSNIMLRPDRAFFLIDFGIARTFTPGKTRDTTPLGSPGYAPPEQYGRAQTDQRSDIYSLGATLQTLLTGYDPLELRSGQPSRNPQAPSRGLRKLLDAMLSPDASKRPADMARVKKRLEYILQRPLAQFLSGLIYPLAISIFWLFFSLFTLWTKHLDGSLSWLILIPVIAAGVTQKLVNKKMRLPNKLQQGFTRFYLFGMLAGFLPLLVWEIFLR